MRFEDRVLIVTGSGSGIGRAIALRLAKEGARVVVADISVERGNEVVDEITEFGGKAMAMVADVSNSGEVNRMVKSTLDHYGQIDILVNNAGGTGAREKRSFFHESTEEVWDFVLGVNLRGVLNCSRAVVNHMIERRRGKIISIGSFSAMIGSVKGVDYCAAKAGVFGFTKALAKELGPYGINVNCVSPGPTTTPHFLTRTPEDVERFRKQSLVGRLGKPEDIAAMVAFLASDEADFVTGQNIAVDGGFSLGS